MSSMRRITPLYSRKRWLPARFYVDSRDAVDDGSGNVASVADRINGWSFTESGLSLGVKPLIDTVLLGGTKLIRFTNSRANLRYTGSTGFSGAANSFVVRMRRTQTNSNWIIHSYETGASQPNITGIEIQANGTTAIRTKLDSGSTTDIDTTTTWSNNTWYTIGITLTGSKLRVFKDGAFVQEHSYTGSLGTHGEIMLGNRGASPTALAASCLQGYYAAWKGWVTAISDAQHLYEHNQLAAWAA